MHFLLNPEIDIAELKINSCVFRFHTSLYCPIRSFVYSCEGLSSGGSSPLNQLSSIPDY